MSNRFFITHRTPRPGPLGTVIAVGMLVVSLAFPACQPKERAAGETRQVTDELGRTVKIVVHPQRIVSLAPSVTETLFALGLSDRIVGVTSYCDYPPEAKTKENVGDTQRPSIERIVALKADLVIASTSSQLEAFVRSLDGVGIPVYVSNPRNLEETLKSILAIGDITDSRDKAADVVRRLRERIERVHARVANSEKPAVFMMLGGQPLITVGRSSFLTDLITQAGGRSISADETADYPQYSLETVLARQPEVIFSQMGGEPLPERLKLTPAAKNGRIHHVADDLMMRPGPRIVDGLEELAAKIHPLSQAAAGGQ